MIKETRISLDELVLALSEAMDLINPVVVNHHRRVAYIAFHIAKEMKLPQKERNDIFLAALLHDSGAFSLQEKLDALNFELSDPHGHAERGYAMLRRFGPLEQAALFVKHHHTAWSEGEGARRGNDEVPLCSHILHLADRADVLFDRHKRLLEQSPAIVQTISANAGNMFVPDLVEVFQGLAQQEAFWLDIESSALPFLDQKDFPHIEIDLSQLEEVAELFSCLVDFRSRFTATHSEGVASCAESIANLFGFSERECVMIRIAGYLHDLGKLAIPGDVLEKPGKLSPGDYNLIKCHTYYTYHILRHIKGLETITRWASLHHERLDGNGYPFHLDARDIPLGSRIVAVADIFTALTEDRPYRKGMHREEVLRILASMVSQGAIDGKVVSALQQNFADINHAREVAQREKAERYNEVLVVN